MSSGSFLSLSCFRSAVVDWLQTSLDGSLALGTYTKKDHKLYTSSRFLSTLLSSISSDIRCRSCIEVFAEGICFHVPLNSLYSTFVILSILISVLCIHFLCFCHHRGFFFFFKLFRILDTSSSL